MIMPESSKLEMCPIGGSLRLHWLPDVLGRASTTPDSSLWSMEALRGMRFAFSSMAGAHTLAVLNIFIGILIFLVLRLLLRKTWIAVLGVSVLWASSCSTPEAAAP